jgi:hypothetical protein
MPRYDAPTTVPTVATGIKKGTNWVLGASGGIQFQPWAFAANVAAADLAPTRTAALTARPATSPLAWE